MRDRLGQGTVYEETLGEVTVQIHRIEGEYQIVLLSDRMAYFSPPFTSLEDCKAEIRAMKDLDEAEELRQQAA